MADTNHIVTSQNEKTTLLGTTKQDYASILRWMSFANTEMLPVLRNWIVPLLGREPYNKKNVDEAIKASAKVMDALEHHLVTHTFLVGERITLADLFTAGLVNRAFVTVSIDSCIIFVNLTVVGFALCRKELA